MPVKKRPTVTSSKKRRTVAKNIPAIQKKYTKTEILNEIAAKTAVNRKDVSAVLEELNVLIERHIKKRAVGEFTLPGL